MGWQLEQTVTSKITPSLQIGQLGPIRTESGFLHQRTYHWSKVKTLFCQKMLLMIVWAPVMTWMSAQKSWTLPMKLTCKVILPTEHTCSLCI